MMDSLYHTLKVGIMLSLNSDVFSTGEVTDARPLLLRGPYWRERTILVKYHQ